MQGILLVNKPRGKTSFHLVAALRRLSKIRKIGHAGTLDPFATGVMVMLIGREFTRLSDSFLSCDKEYTCRAHLGISTDSFDCEGVQITSSDKIPTEEEIRGALLHFQGEIQQIPPMFSAKKVQGKKLYELARKGISIERAPATVTVCVELLNYTYPHLDLRIRCSKGTYIRSIAHDLGTLLGCGAHLIELQRTRSGNYLLEECLDGSVLESKVFDLIPHLRCI
jgi:tRNA pseudouridine55 synthase